MSRALHRLTAVEVKRISEPGMHADDGGLYLRVAARGCAKSWISQYRFGGKRRDMGLGGYPSLSLARAREAAAEAREALAAGVLKPAGGVKDRW